MAALGLLAGVGPKDAASHLAEWAALVGVENVPSWLAGRTADRWGMAIGCLGFVAWGFWHYGLYGKIKIYGRNEDAYKFENLLNRGADLLSEGQDSINLDVALWRSRVILWDQDVRELLRLTAPIDFLVYRNIGQHPQQNHDREVLLNTLRERRNKLRLVMGRVILK
jgi:hypothetical protein